MLIFMAGMIDGLYRGFGVPLWAAIPLGMVAWAGLAYRMYLQSQKERAMQDDPSEPSQSSA
jgi:hypothetical protein